MHSGHRRIGRLATYVTCEISRRVYRWSRSSWRVEKRFKRLRSQLPDLPLSGVGLLVSELDPALEERLEPCRKADRELVVADFDQNGLIASRFGAIAGVPTITAEEFMPRTGCPVLLVDINGRLGVRKEFGSANRGRFVQELEALLHLQSSDCPVPRLMNVDWDACAITMTFVPGDVVRELLAVAGADIRDRDSDGNYSRAMDRQRIRSGRELVPTVLTKRHIHQVASGLNAIHEAGFVLEDVKFGNIILQAQTGEPIFVDLERALPVSSLPDRLADHLRQVDLRKLREHFGEAPERSAA
jgi:tRNA A-37 threonylcarbamoyl transferase component Bud32